MDIFLIAMLLVSGIHGAKNGFACTMRYFLLWFVCLTAGIFGCQTVKSLLLEHTGIGDYIRDVLQLHAETPVFPEVLPDSCADWFEGFSGTWSDELTASLGDRILTLIAFLLIVLAVRLIFALYVRLFSKKYHEGLTGFTDGMLGLVFGLARGIFFILLTFIVLVPVISLLSPDTGLLIGEAMEDSILASVFYNNNILLAFLS